MDDREIELALDTSPEGRAAFLRHAYGFDGLGDEPSTTEQLRAAEEELAAAEEDAYDADETRREVWHRYSTTAEGRSRSLSIEGQQAVTEAQEKDEAARAVLDNARRRVNELLARYDGI